MRLKSIREDLLDMRMSEQSNRMRCAVSGANGHFVQRDVIKWYHPVLGPVWKTITDVVFFEPFDWWGRLLYCHGIG